jgi:hypothetical protein
MTPDDALTIGVPAADIDAALATVEHPTEWGNKTWLLCVYLPAAKIVASAVRELRQEVARERGERIGTAQASITYAAANKKLGSENAELRAENERLKAENEKWRAMARAALAPEAK